MRHVIESQQFDRGLIEKLFVLADESSIKKDLPLRGKLMASLFYEPSTRTRFSFESAMHRLGGAVISTENASEYSSAAKGESLEDSIRTVNQSCDVIVLRHPELGASKRAAAVSDVPVINAGDGAGQHPTQSLLDLYTIKKEIGRIDDISVVMVGDLKYGRTVRSLAYLLGKYDKLKITFLSPPALKMENDIKDYLDKNRVSWQETDQWLDTLETADVVYQTRVQKERFTSLEDYQKQKDRFIFTNKELAKMKPEAVVMHPLPRVNEIAVEVDSSPRAAYFRQVKNGLHIRMALLQFLLADS